MALSWGHHRVVSARHCDPVAFKCSSSTFASSPCAVLVSFNFASVNFGRNRGIRPKEKKKNNTAFDFLRDGSVFPVRSHAEVERADGQAEFETGVDEKGRNGWNGEQDNKKAKALGDSTIYPIMRVYRDDLCSLEVTGDAKAWQVIEAMAADGGYTAAEELSKGRSLMTVETIIPGRAESHATVSTKLLAPTQLVNKSSKTKWAQRSRTISMSSGNALARAFQTVVMQHLLSFDIHVHSPGMVRDMANLANENEDGVVASLESRDASVLEGLAEVLCTYLIANINDNFYQRVSGKSRYNKIFSFLRKPEWIWALNQAIGICPLSESEILEHVNRVLNEPNSSIGEKIRTHQAWWPPPVTPFLSDMLPEQGLNSWSTEFIPIHKVQIDTSKVNVLAKGWQTTKSEQVLELHLTHSQLVDVADMLDMYYEDAYTTPAKILRTGIKLKVPHVSRSKVTKALWTALLSCVAAGVLLVGVLAVARLKTSSSTGFLRNTSTFAASASRSDSSFTTKWCRVKTKQLRLPNNDDVSAEEMEELCLKVVKRVQEAFNLVGQVDSSPERGAWIGKDLTQWGRGQSTAQETVDSSAGTNLLELRHGEAAQETSNVDSVDNGLSEETLLLYQVVLSRNGKVLGFQPGNIPAVAHWVEYPFAHDLHKDQRLGPGLFEHRLKYLELSEDVVAIELICLSDSDVPSVSARPLKL